jgi:hypothetical protein
MPIEKIDDLDAFLSVKKRRKELLHAYESNFHKKSLNGNIIEYAQNENLLSTADQEMLSHHLNLFLQDKHVLREFLTLNENRLVDVNDCLKAERFLESFEIIILNLAQNATFKIKVIDLRKL